MMPPHTEDDEWDSDMLADVQGLTMRKVQETSPQKCSMSIQSSPCEKADLEASSLDESMEDPGRMVAESVAKGCDNGWCTKPGCCRDQCGDRRLGIGGPCVTNE